MRSARINGVGVYLPEREVTNKELGEMINYDVEGFLKSFGIKRRFLSSDYETPSYMAVEASKEALNMAGLGAKDLDLIILATDTPDYITPPSSPIIQHKLGAENAGAFDINAACTDQTIALAIGAQYLILDDDIENVLVTAPYGMTNWIDFSLYSLSASNVLALLFSDGAGSVILSQGDEDEEGYLSSSTMSEGQYWDSYGVYVGTARLPTEEMIEKRQHSVRFHEYEHYLPPNFNADRWPKLIKESLEKAGYEVDDLDMVLYNQLDKKAVHKTMERLGLPMEKTHLVMDRYGYAGSASVFMAFYDALEQGKIERGDLIAFCNSGSGFVLGAALFRY